MSAAPPDEHFGERRIEPGQFRQDVHADAIALKIHIGVGGVFAPGDVAGCKPGTDFVPANIKERPNDAVGGLRADSAEAGGAGAAQETEEDGLGLIVQGMAGGDGFAEALPDAIREEFVTEAAGFLLDIALAGRERGSVERKAKGTREFANESFIGVGFRPAKFVIDVENCRRQVQFVQSRQQEYGIGATGDGDSDLHRINANGCKDAIKHTLILRAGLPFDGRARDALMAIHA